MFLKNYLKRTIFSRNYIDVGYLSKFSMKMQGMEGYNFNYLNISIFIENYFY